jgi:multiple sugar transport system ATP-binding protein
MTMADRIVVFKDGVIQQSGSPGEIYSRPVNRFVAEFIGSPSMNFFAVEASNALLTFAAAKTTIPVPPHLREAVQKFGRPGLHLGIRPENLRLDPQGAIKARVSVVEPLGADTLVFFSFGTGEHCLRVPPEQRVEVDEEISLSFDPAKSHLFCRESGRAV